MSDRNYTITTPYRGGGVIYTWQDEIQDYSRKHAPVTERLDVPVFDNQVDADAWMAAHDVARQIYATGSHVAFWREVEMYEAGSGLVLPKANIEYVGKVVAWKPNWVMATHTDPRPRYQLLTLSWVHEQPETIWVMADDIIGQA